MSAIKFAASVAHTCSEGRLPALTVFRWCRKLSKAAVRLPKGERCFVPKVLRLNGGLQSLSRQEIALQLLEQRDVFFRAFEQVPVCVHCHGDGCVTQQRLYLLRVSALFDKEGCCGMAQSVDSKLRLTAIVHDAVLDKHWFEDAVVDVGVVLHPPSAVRENKRQIALQSL